MDVNVRMIASGLLFVILCCLLNHVEAGGLMCGQTHCKESEFCCNKNVTDTSGAKNCCCAMTGNARFVHCFTSNTAPSMLSPFWALMLTVVVVIGWLAGVEDQRFN